MNELLDDPDFAASAPCATLRARGLGFIDVGVRGGLHPLVEPIAGVTSALAFEPDAAEAARLAALYKGSRDWAEVVIDPAGLAETTGKATLYRCTANTNDSLRPINKPFVDRYRMDKFQPVGETAIDATSVDEVLRSRHAGRTFGEVIKLDTQATELEILRGARETLSTRTVALLVEVWYTHPYAGQAVFSDIELHLRELGFAFYGTTFHYRSRKLLDKARYATRERPLWSDAVFFKDPLAGAPVRKQLDERGLHVLFTSALLLGYHDFALELAIETWAQGAERARIERLVARRARLPRVRTILDVVGLAARVLANPFRANVTVGKFIDARRELCSYEEVPR
jgi:FkbM family methyltransferase